MLVRDDIDYANRTRRAYTKAFSGAAGKYVLADLAGFCRAMEPTHVAGDPHQSAHNEGARSVILRIYSFLRMTADDANALHDRQMRGRLLLEDDDA